MLRETCLQVSSEPTLLKYIGPFDQITVVYEPLSRCSYGDDVKA